MVPLEEEFTEVVILKVLSFANLADMIVSASAVKVPERAV